MIFDECLELAQQIQLVGVDNGWYVAVNAMPDYIYVYANKGNETINTSSLDRDFKSKCLQVICGCTVNPTPSHYQPVIIK